MVHGYEVNHAFVCLLLLSGKFLFRLCFELLRLQKQVFESTSSSRGIIKLSLLDKRDIA